MFKIKFWISSFRVVEHDSYSIKKSLENHFFVIHEKTWISWYSRILTNLKFFSMHPTLPSNLPTRSISSVEVPLFIFVLKLILSKIAVFLSKLALCLLFVNFRQNLFFTIFDFLIFVFDFFDIFSLFFRMRMI